MTDYIAPALRGLAAYQLPGASGIVRNTRQKTKSSPQPYG